MRVFPISSGKGRFIHDPNMPASEDLEAKYSYRCLLLPGVVGMGWSIAVRRAARTVAPAEALSCAQF